MLQAGRDSGIGLGCGSVDIFERDIRRVHAKLFRHDLLGDGHGVPVKWRGLAKSIAARIGEYSLHMALLIDASGCIERTGFDPHWESRFVRSSLIANGALLDRCNRSILFEPDFCMRISLRICRIVIILPFVDASDRLPRSPGQQRRNELGAADDPVAVFAPLEQGAAMELVEGEIVHGEQLKMRPT